MSPAPWKLIDSDDHVRGRLVVDREGEGVAEGMSAADARLIAAAPELLQALKVILVLVETLGIEKGAELGIARAIVAKASL
jgi:hypothetical protein